MQLDHLWAGTHGRVRRIQNPVIAQDQGVDHIAPLLLHLLLTKMEVVFVILATFGS